MKTRPHATIRPRGFALVVTVSLMVLLAVMCVGLLGLSAVSLRSSTQSQAQAEAQANARLALMIAIGELQKQLGPDQRVSANGAILSESQVRNPHWTGAWNSWQAGTKDPANPTPDAPSAHRTIPGTRDVPSGMNPTYSAGRSDHFRSWLLSLNPSEATSIDSARNLALDGDIMPGESANAVRLVGQGTVGTVQQGADARDYVSARLLPVEAGGDSPFRGRYGWWVGDESQKARLMNDSYITDADNSLAGRLSRQQAPGSMGTRTLPGFENITDERQLAGLPSFMTVSLIDGTTEQAERNFHHATPFSYHVLADVREGGLKRDLSTLLERPITLSETGDEFMLYKFSTKDQWMSGNDNQEAVPIHDLAAYYQLYDSNRSGWKEGLRYSSNLLSNGMQVVSPDYGDGAANDPAFARQYTALYRQPVPVKLQFLLSLFAEAITPAPRATRDNPDPATHVLRVGVTPSLTLWNPNNVPLVMNFNDGNPNRFAQLLRSAPVPLHITWNKNDGEYVSDPVNLTWFAYGAMQDNKAHFLNLYFSGKRPVRFEPGEIRTFSLPFSGETSGVKGGGDGHNPYYTSEYFYKTDKYYEGHEVVAGWEPRSFMLFNRSARNVRPPHVIEYTPPGAVGRQRTFLAFKSNDRISFEIKPQDSSPTGDGTGGAPLYFKLIQSNHQSYTQYGGSAQWGRNHYVQGSRRGTGGSQASFTQELLAKGFPGGNDSIVAASRSGSNLIARSGTAEGWPFLHFSLQAGVETHENSNGGVAGGRKFATRPFLHASALPSPFIEGFSGNSLYDSGWSWSIDEINEVLEAPVQVTADNQSYYGGGYTPEFGTTHVLQQEIPVMPPMSIASLSHARLGGFSIADEVNPNAENNQVITATGQAGLFPHTLQAIGNSYAHPLLAADKAFDTYQRTFSTNEGARNVTLADHSYLANKALWDEFFFSSITPQPSSVRAYDGAGRTAKQVAGDFFFDDKPLPNRRIQPFNRNIDEAELDELFTRASVYRDGLADRIAAHLMVEGPFNVNSTSVDAWKTLLSSLKGKPVAYLDKDNALNGVIDPDSTSISGTPVGPSSLPNGQPADGSNDPQDPEQWYSWRELNDTEIQELAEAIVKQVKRRGPFLSLSEFVNRRLDSGNPELSAKGALQAALDDPDVSINAGFRNATRQFGNEKNEMNPAFPEALDGPVAYGSAAYVDQADILRNFAAQLTPRGDTFVVRSYGDALDNAGNVVARAWCEAVVQRVPEYFDPADDPHLGQVALTSDSNKTFGRKLEIVTFRWLNPDEI